MTQILSRPRDGDPAKLRAYAWHKIETTDLSEASWKHFVNGAIQVWLENDVLLHVWHPDLRTVPDDEQMFDIHTHAHIVRSVVLEGEGTLECRTYDVRPAEQGEDGVIAYRILVGTEMMVPEDRMVVENEKLSVYRKGDILILPKGAWHKAHATDLILTVVFADELEPKRPYYQLGRSSNSSTPPEVRRRAAARIRSILSTLSPSSVESRIMETVQL